MAQIVSAEKRQNSQGIEKYSTKIVLLKVGQKISEYVGVVYQFGSSMSASNPN